MAEVVWLSEAVDQLDQIVAYVALFHPAAANRLGHRLISLGGSLAEAPNRGRPSNGGTRELVTVRPYILRYRVRGDVVTILSARHSRRAPEND